MPLSLSKQWHNKRFGWSFYPKEFVHNFSIFQDTYDIDTLLAQAHQARPDMGNLGNQLATELRGTFTLAANKTKESAIRKIRELCSIEDKSYAEGDADQIIDPIRGVIIVDTNDDIQRVRTKLKNLTSFKQDTILKISDRYSRPPEVPIRGIYMYVRLPNNVIGEIQIHTADYWRGFQATHQAYQAHRSLKDEKNIQALPHHLSDAEQEEVPLAHEWTKADNSRLLDAKRKRIHELNEVAKTCNVKVLELRDTNYQDDCSYPLRPHIDPKTGKFGYLVPSIKELKEKLIDEDAIVRARSFLNRGLEPNI